ncbi:barstar family protein [Burkholderia pseudomallei]|uniref:barstar family protein n=1 Tax=Burkholderia pseudomallei TaxID=28450 RepID=UPI000A1A26B2|nr:barstar family protein [Burkholderia pseudomallei]ARK49397.1 barnase inhibitor [Burkholderia pseudomallei]ARK53703.1 barnase inhibitor [Burkholderia pseudomallei]ARL07619.1 barnase inhibitor [Burkholderia pseudomallei]ARL15823.1 barnase inhibitor [Burkholderia pseudomallei]ARL23792.1 barnase inhibitor [Burkholderia pseudomallei]
MKIELSGEAMFKEADFHKQLSEALGVQSYYGCNLDALWDLLSAGVERPLVIVWKNSSASKKNMGVVFDELVGVLERVKLQDENFKWDDKFTYMLA